MVTKRVSLFCPLSCITKACNRTLAPRGMPYRAIDPSLFSILFPRWKERKGLGYDANVLLGKSTIYDRHHRRRRLSWHETYILLFNICMFGTDWAWNSCDTTMSYPFEIRLIWVIRVWKKQKWFEFYRTLNFS